MHAADVAVLALYFTAMLVIGVRVMRRQRGANAYFVGDRDMSAGHVGLSVVATDVGGGFSIGLGGLGFTLGLSGSWLLFTGLLGAWLAAVLVIPRVKPLADAHGWTTFADYLAHRFDARTQRLAAVVSGLGYAAFVGAQVLAGAKLASVAFDLDLHLAVFVTAAIVIGYTALGGLQAVVLTDLVQWGVLLVGLALFALPAAWSAVGGLDGLTAALPAGHLSLTQASGADLLGWAVGIIPIWFVANTLYQRIYAARDVATAKRAWYLAGLLEWPLIALLGTALGVIARVLFPTADPEGALPLLIREVLPIGLTGAVLAAYFAAIMSTADSCLLAASGHFVGDLYRGVLRPRATDAQLLRVSRAATLLIGVASVLMALVSPSVLEAILLAYAFMVSGLFVPTLAGLLWPRATPAAAFWSMLAGGTTAVAASAVPAAAWPAWLAFVPAQPVLTAIGVAAAVLVTLTLRAPAPAPVDAVDAAEAR